MYLHYIPLLYRFLIVLRTHLPYSWSLHFTSILPVKHHTWGYPTCCYQNLFDAVGKLAPDESNDIGIEEYAFDLNPDLKELDHFNIIKQGSAGGWKVKHDEKPRKGLLVRTCGYYCVFYLLHRARGMTMHHDIMAQSLDDTCKRKIYLL